jgi:hypothetical protein
MREEVAAISQCTALWTRTGEVRPTRRETTIARTTIATIAVANTA